MAQLHRPFAWLLVATVVCTVVAAAQQQPTFRTEIDSVQLDVRVVDQDGRFVRGLTRDDLQVYEDFQRQAIVPDFSKRPLHVRAVSRFVGRCVRL